MYLQLRSVKTYLNHAHTYVRYLVSDTKVLTFLAFQSGPAEGREKWEGAGFGGTCPSPPN